MTLNNMIKDIDKEIVKRIYIDKVLRSDIKDEYHLKSKELKRIERVVIKELVERFIEEL